MLTEAEAIDRACAFFAVSGGTFITGPAESGVEYRPGLCRLQPRAHLEDGVYSVFFDLLPPLADRIDPNFSVVEVQAATGACGFGAVM